MATAMKFTALPSLYLLSEGANAATISNQLHARQAQLSAMLAMTFGDAAEALRTLSDSEQENFMWACHMLATEIQELTCALLAFRNGGAA